MAGADYQDRRHHPSGKTLYTALSEGGQRFVGA